MSDLYKPITPEIYVPLWQHPDSARDVALLVKTSVDPGTLTGAVRREVLSIDLERPVYSVETLEGIGRECPGAHATLPSHSGNIRLRWPC